MRSMHADPAQVWLRDAQGDLALARVKKTRAIRYAHLCFHAQQAAEKSLKAVYLALDTDLPRTHDLAFLIDNLPKRLPMSPTFLVLPTLTKYAVQFRYPGQDIPVTRRDWLTAVDLATEIYHWAQAQVDGIRKA